MSSHQNAYSYLGLWRGIGFALLGAAFTAFLVPVSPSLPSFSLEDKAVHFLIYAVLAYWFLQIYSKQIIVAFLLVVMGVAVEGLQSMTSYRSAEIADMLANTIGVFAGWLLFRSPMEGVVGVLDRRLASLRYRRPER